MIGAYKAPSKKELTYISEIQKLLTNYCSSYDKILLLMDFNMPFSNKDMKDLYDMFDLNHLMKGSACFKSSTASYIDNFYTNKKASFFNSSTGISDHRSLIL